MEIQQSPPFASFTKSLHWTVIPVDGVNIFIRTFPFLGTMAKIQRPVRLPNIARIRKVLSSYHVTTIVAEASRETDPKKFTVWANTLKRDYRLSTSPYLPTKTILVSLLPSEEKIFAGFTSAKRRAVRRALNLGVRVEERHDIAELIRIKNKSAGLFGFITTFGMEKLWPVFAPDHAAILLAYAPSSQTFIRRKQKKEIVGGILLLFWENTSYYWIAGATRTGKKLFAPTLLAWEAIKLSKQRGMKQFDFVGAWDERLPRQYDTWKGFTKFKEGFGGKALYYPIHTS